MPKTSPAPADELARLLERRRKLIEAAQEADTRSRFTGSDVVDAQVAVEQAERARLAGDGS